MLWTILIPIALFVGMILANLLGQWLGTRRLTASPDGGSAGPVEGMVLALLGLLIAFTFNSAAERFNQRRSLMVDQANALGTAWLRTDLLHPSDRDALRRIMLQWVEHAIEIGHDAERRDWDAYERRLATAGELQSRTWRLASDAVKAHELPPIATLALPPINDWIDLTTKRLQLNNMGVSSLIMETLYCLSLVAAFQAGFGASRICFRSRVQSIIMAAVLAFSVYVILDISDPRSGLVQVGGIDQVMIELQRGFRAELNAPTTRPM